MISFFVKFKNIILIAIIACFLGSVGYVGVGALREEYGSPLRRKSGRSQRTEAGF